ncbi:VanZ family protein [Pontibacillus sp. HMF3514]|uniref:VanZ family protein n=1 Tax=Pontibacillus sp. HMF3514 TaxID=2692425 RepID=UPI00131F5E75|nr:VanZ family protein [Pontibacillus sp. HMF3514]QHE53622.1 VanZ family protein [Pontibacillus sp. HMF3514]
MKKMLYWLLPLSWMGVIFYSSSTPYQEQDMKPFLSKHADLSFLKPHLDSIVFTYHQSEVSVANLGVEGFIEYFLRKGAHVTVFLLLFLLIYIAFRKTTNLTLHVCIGWSFIITVIYAAFDEVHQGFTPNRTPYFGDVVLDTAGALIGLGLVYLYMFGKVKKGKKTNKASR